jgi:hypothetical protein
MNFDELITSSQPGDASDVSISLNGISEGSVKLRLATATLGLLTSTLPMIADNIAQIAWIAWGHT